MHADAAPCDKTHSWGQIRSGPEQAASLQCSRHYTSKNAAMRSPAASAALMGCSFC